jgi:hypothetical protein
MVRSDGSSARSDAWCTCVVATQTPSSPSPRCRRISTMPRPHVDRRTPEHRPTRRRERVERVEHKPEGRRLPASGRAGRRGLHHIASSCHGAQRVPQASGRRTDARGGTLRPCAPKTSPCPSTPSTCPATDAPCASPGSAPQASPWSTRATPCSSTRTSPARPSSTAPAGPCAATPYASRSGSRAPTPSWPGTRISTTASTCPPRPS